MKITDLINEMPIALNKDEPNNPTIHNHKGVTSMSLKSRIASARSQLKELAESAESDDLLVWEGICKKVKGGMFVGLTQNIEQIEHAIEELAKTRKKGGKNAKGIDKDIGPW